MEQEKMIERHQHKRKENIMKRYKPNKRTVHETENQEDIEEGTGNIIEDENNIYWEELNEEQLRRKENLQRLWKKNFDKYLNMNIEDREYSTKTKPIPEKQQLELLDQLVYEEVELLEEKYEINLWILNVIHSPHEIISTAGKTGQNSRQKPNQS